MSTLTGAGALALALGLSLSAVDKSPGEASTKKVRPLNPARAPKRTVINGDAMEGSRSKGITKVIGHVKVTQEGVKITCDLMTVFYEGSMEDGCKRILCDGHVKVVEKDRWGRGEHADYDNVNGVLVSTGAPELWDAHSHVTGSKITFFVGTDNYHVDNPKVVTDGADKEASSLGKSPAKVPPRKAEGAK